MEAGARRDPAERGHLRFFYRDWRPTRFGRLHNRAYAWLASLGLTPQILLALQVKDRSTGRLRTTVLVPVELDGRRYLVSMLGEGSEWVQNLRAAGGEGFVRRVTSRPVRLVEIPSGERAPILKAWCQIATSGRKHLPVTPDAALSAFEGLAADYPVFRIDPR
jgi:hypothetical protein